MIVRVTTWMLTAVVALVAVVACGGDDETAGGDSATESGVLTEETFLDGLRDGIEATNSAHVELELDGPQQATMSADMDYQSRQPEIDMTMSGAVGEMHLILVDGVGYLSSPELSGSDFLELDPQKDNGQLSQVVEEMVDAADLESQFEPWQAGLTDVEYVGQDSVGGTEATQYRITVDAEKAYEAQGESIPAGLPETIEYGIWVDDENRMLKVQFEIAGTSATMNITGHDDDITIERPRKAQIRQP